MFTPRHPATKPKMSIILEGEAKLDSQALIDKAVADTEIVRL